MLARSSEEPRRIDLATEPPFRLGELRVVPALRQIYRGEEGRTLEPRVMQVLVALAKAEGGIVGRDALVDSCWDGRIVGDNAINRVISLLRALAAETAAFEIETITKVGYRLKANAAVPSLPPEQAGTRPSRPDRRAALAIMAAAGLVGAGWLVGPDLLFPNRRHARELYQAGQEIERQGNPERIRQAIAYYRDATNADPDFADAWGALARAMLQLLTGEDRNAEAISARVGPVAERALRLDPGNADALIALVLIRPMFRRWAEAERETREVLARRPELGLMRERLGWNLANTGRLRNARRVFEDLVAQEPLVPSHQLNLAFAAWNSGDPARASKIYEMAARTWPDSIWTWTGRFMFLSLSGRPDAALATATPDLALMLASGPIPMETGMLCAKALMSREAKSVDAAVDSIVTMRAKGHIASFMSIPYLSALGALDIAFEHAWGYYLGQRDRATGERTPLPDTTDRWTDLLFAVPTAPMRADPRFPKLTEAVGLEGYWRTSGTLPDYRRA